MIDTFRKPRRFPEELPSQLDFLLQERLANADECLTPGAEQSSRSEVEKALRHSESYLRAILETTPECVTLVDVTGTLLEINLAGCRMLEADFPGNVLGRSFYSFIAPEFREAYAGFNEKVCQGHKGELEFQLVGWKGSRRWLVAQAVPFRSLQNGSMMQLAMIRDLTQPRRSELRDLAFCKLGERLNASLSPEQAGRIIVEIADNLIGWDACSLCLYSAADDHVRSVLNMGTLRGRKRDGAAVSSATPTEFIRRVIEHGAQLILRDDEPDARDGAPPGDARRSSAAVLAVPIRHGGQVTGVLSIHSYTLRAYAQHDLETLQALADYCSGALERIRVEESLRCSEAKYRRLAEDLELRVRERTAALRRTNEQMESFCYSVSHDLRAPLRAMRGFSEVLLSNYEDRLDESGQEFLRRIKGAGDRMDRLIEDLLAYSRLERMELTLEPIDLDAILQFTEAELAMEIRERGAVVHIQRPLPAVMANETILEQIFTNLISNALKFVAPGIQPVIHITARARGEMVRVRVRDNGIGIAAEYRERIFRVFERLHGMTNYAGTGIGLAIVQKGVERMGGQVGVASTPGKGSTFWIDLPQAAVSGSEAVQPESACAAG